MSGLTPNFEDWALLSSLTIWEAATLMHGYDPRALSDVLVRDPDDPSSTRGVPLDTTWIERQLLSALELGKLLQVKDGLAVQDRASKITMVSLRNWLTQNGYAELATNLDGYGSSPGRAANRVRARVLARDTHRDAILDAIQRLGYKKDSLPRQVGGSPGLKANVRALLDNDPSIRTISKKSFDKAWQGLRDDRIIVEGE
jgi:hypothetical protein